MTPAAICFDLDDTLCVSTQDPHDVLSTAFERVGVEPFCTPTDLECVLPDLPPAWTDLEFYENLFAAAATQVGRDGSFAPALARAYLEAVDPAAVELCPGARAALEVAGEVAPIALVTNGGRETQTTKLRALELTDVFDAAAFTDLERGIHPKPDSAPFEHVLDTLDVPAERAIHVGNSLHADVRGANAAGLHSVWVSAGCRNHTHYEPTYTVDSLAEFETVL